MAKIKDQENKSRKIFNEITIEKGNVLRMELKPVYSEIKNQPEETKTIALENQITEENQFSKIFSNSEIISNYKSVESSKIKNSEEFEKLIVYLDSQNSPEKGMHAYNYKEKYHEIETGINDLGVETTDKNKNTSIAMVIGSEKSIAISDTTPIKSIDDLKWMEDQRKALFGEWRSTTEKIEQPAKFENEQPVDSKRNDIIYEKIILTDAMRVFESKQRTLLEDLKPNLKSDIAAPNHQQKIASDTKASGLVSLINENEENGNSETAESSSGSEILEQVEETIKSKNTLPTSASINEQDENVIKIDSIDNLSQIQKVEVNAERSLDSAALFNKDLVKNSECDLNEKAEEINLPSQYSANICESELKKSNQELDPKEKHKILNLSSTMSLSSQLLGNMADNKKLNQEKSIHGISDIKEKTFVSKIMKGIKNSRVNPKKSDVIDPEAIKFNGKSTRFLNAMDFNRMRGEQREETKIKGPTEAAKCDSNILSSPAAADSSSIKIKHKINNDSRTNIFQNMTPNSEKVFHKESEHDINSTDLIQPINFSSLPVLPQMPMKDSPKIIAADASESKSSFRDPLFNVSKSPSQRILSKPPNLQENSDGSEMSVDKANRLDQKFSTKMTD